MNILDSKNYVAMVLNGYRNLKANYETINDLNVFPVPDGDTGTNMTSTFTGGVKAVEKIDVENTPISIIGNKMGGGMLLSARGNSGVILSQFFAGIGDGFEGLDQVTIEQFSNALEKGVKKAYEAVVTPTEGTILTVAREGSEFISKNIDSIKDYETLFELLIKEMKKSLANTPNLLACLKEAGVIDSGGAGLVSIIEGMGKQIAGEKIEDTDFKGPISTTSSDDVQFNADSVMTYGYCTEFILQLQNAKCDPSKVDVKDFVKFLETIGDSIVAVKNETIIKVHVHTLTPWKAIQFAQQYGEFVTFKMENMSIQHNEVLLKEESNTKKERTKVAIVAVAPSEQISSFFKDMGANVTIRGGQTMNPSAENFIEAFDEANADTIIAFPNNGNVILTAEQAAEMYKGSKVIVMHTKSAAECYSALSMLDLENNTLDEMLETMEACIEHVVSGEVCPAVRDSVNNGLQIKKDDFMAISRGSVVASEANINDALMKLLSSVEDADDREVLTVFIGQDATEEMTEAFKKSVKGKYPFMEFVEIPGGQAIYPYLIALE